MSTDVRPDIVTRFGYLAAGVNDVDEGREFRSPFVRLEQTERVGDTALMTGDAGWALAGTSPLSSRQRMVAGRRPRRQPLHRRH